MAPQTPEDRPQSALQAVLPKLLLSLALGGLFAWVAARGGLPLWPDARAFAAVRWWAVPAYLASLCLLHFLRASRFRFLIAPVKPLPLGEVLRLNFIGFAAIFLLPLRLGEVARPALGKLRHGIPLSAGFGTVAVERVVDGLLTSLCVGWALWALPRVETADPVARHLPTYGYAALLLFTCAFAALSLFLWQRTFAMRLTRGVVGLVSPRLAELLAGKVNSVADGLRSIGSPRLGAGFLLESVAYWGVNALGVYTLARGCGLAGFTPGHAAAIMGVLAIGILLPSGPGLFGNFQLAVAAGLRLYFPESIIAGQGAVFIFLLYVLQSTVMLVAGLWPLYTLRLGVGDLLGLRGSPTQTGASAENLRSPAHLSDS